MPVKVNLPPPYGTVTIDGVAEEATMRSILTALKGTPGTGGKEVPKGGSGAGGDDPNKDAKEGSNKLKTTLNVVGDTVAGSASTFAKTFTNTAPSIKDFGNFISGLPLADIKGVNELITNFSGVVGDQVEIFRTLSGAGIDLGDRITEAQYATARARLPLDIFAKTVTANSQTLAMAFGTASQGANKFADISGAFMEKSGKKFAYLGFTQDELATYNASYLTILQRSGRLQKMTADQIANLPADLDKYNTELDKLSKATGISRQQLDEQNQAQQRDARMRLATQKLGTDQQLALTGTIEQLKKLDPSGEFAAGIQDLIASGGVATTKAARDAVQAANKAGVDLQGATRNIYNGVEGSVANLNKGLEKVGRAGSELSEGERRLGVTMATMGNKTPGLVQATISGFTSVTDAAAKTAEEQKKKLDAAAKDPLRQATATDQVLTQVSNTFKTAFLDTPVLTNTASAINGLGDAALGFAKKFETFSTEGKLATLIGAEAGKSIYNILKDMASKALDNAGSIAASAAAGYAGGKAGSKTPETKTPKTPEPDAKTPKTPDGKPGAGKILKEGVEELGEKPSWWQKIMGAAKRNKYVILGTTAAGAAVYFSEDLIDMATPDFLKARRTFESGTMPTSSAPTAGANVPQNLQTGPGGQTQIGQISREASELNTALKNIDYSKMIIPEAVGTSIDQSSIKLKNLKDTISTTTSAFKDLNNVNLNTLNESINKLNSTVERQVSQSPVSTDAQKSVATAAPAVEKEMVNLLNQLNMNMGQLVSHQSDAVDYLSKTAKNTRQSLGNLL